ncbi:sigma-70 family RNA polymerase sigma factor [Sphingobium sp. BYY-5]|uniref:RNA polymerase sigma factor n=1 Tax=Sphingobium sp. BYY-5 TaxID=2926400 RepID=UPI001FA7CF65|nr:sigma-70 family RNA polymerase sigma factor [Sphingobium sp. BYY-5]MCI4592165.1 sigma-70 family RNA polymerase sigma factor [Sphingobium sp. BYY-5]
MGDYNLEQTCRTSSGRLWAGWASLLVQVERLTRRHDGEDLLHDAYVRMATRTERPDNEEAFLVRAAINRARDVYRREKVRGPSIGEDALHMVRDSAPMQDEALMARARLERVREGIDKLPPRTREVFLLQRIDNLKYREIAERLEISQSAVEKHMARAMTFLDDWTKDW